MRWSQISKQAWTERETRILVSGIVAMISVVFTIIILGA